METFRMFFRRRHGFEYPTRGGETAEAVLNRLADALADWADELARGVLGHTQSQQLDKSGSPVDVPHTVIRLVDKESNDG